MEDDFKKLDMMNLKSYLCIEDGWVSLFFDCGQWFLVLFVMVFCWWSVFRVVLLFFNNLVFFFIIFVLVFISLGILQLRFELLSIKGVFIFKSLF